MTIHKAKGLGFPVVILILYGEQSRGFKYILDEKEEGVYLLKINQRIAEASDLLQRAYEEERMKEVVNRLNTLYVGFTRPEFELYVIGVSGKKTQFPMDLLQESGHVAVGKKAPARNLEAADQAYLHLYHPTQQVDFFSISSFEELNIEERQRGEFIHRVLFFIEYLDEDLESRLEELIKQIKNESNMAYPMDTIKRELVGFLLDESVKPFFVRKPGRVIRREQDFSDLEGNLLRMDRVIIDEDRVMVMDYKTGGDQKAEERYVLQLKNYMGILRDLYQGKTIEGMIAYVDLQEVVRIN
jgi:ATP-dependent exoDNAse (exonuclease V) beta subunit